MADAKKKYDIATSPVGEAKYAWLNKPDTKYKAEGEYKLDLILSGEPAQKLKADLDSRAEPVFAEFIKDKTTKEKKEWSQYVPYTVETNDEDVPTGNIIFHFRQNALIKTKDGKTHEVEIEMRDSKDKEIHVPVYAGSKVRAMYTVRPITITSNKKMGIRLDFKLVQVKELSKGRKGPGFGELEGGYDSSADEHEEAEGGNEQVPNY